MDLRGINEIRPDRAADACAQAGAGDEPCEHACSHDTPEGGLAVARVVATTLHLHVVGGSAQDPADNPAENSAEATQRLVSASVLKLRGRGHAVLRLLPDETAAAAPGWDGSGWLEGLTRLT